MSHPEFASQDSPASVGQPTDAEQSPPSAIHADPQFGLVDVIEAFTAMRHEWPGQTRETRELAESVQSTVVNMGISADSPDQSVRRTSRRRITEARGNRWSELDHQLTRAVDVFRKVEAGRAVDQARRIERLQAEFQQRSAITRWFARPVLNSALKRTGCVEQQTVCRRHSQRRTHPSAG